MGNPAKASSENTLSYLEELLNRYETVLHQHRLDNPDLYQLIEQHRQAANKVEPPLSALNSADTHIDPPLQSSNDTSLQGPLRGKALRQKIHASHRIIRERVVAMDADTIPRTQAYNRKSPHTTIEGERECREDVLAAQIRAWRSVLPDIIRKFARIPDYRSPSRIKHSMTVVMVFGLFAFIFRLNSRRDMNRSLTGPVIFSQLQTLFPEINTIPHADTLARVLEHVDPKRIEKIHLNLIQSLVRKKKFKKLLIQNRLPIAFDGTQKLTRDGLRYDERWCERIVGNDDEKQQYVYVLEANIILKNGLTIPLMTEYLTREHNALLQVEGKQDSETTTFERLARRLKAYFPRLKILLVLDAMFATQAVMGQAHDYRWDYLIYL